MKVTMMELALKLAGAPIALTSDCYRPPSWPPPHDWIVAMDRHGDPLSEWGDPVWDFTAWAGTSFKLHFTKSPRTHRSELSPANQYLLRMSTTWMIWSPQGNISWKTLKQRFNVLRRIVLLCEQSGIVASDLVRFPQVLRLIAGVVKSSGDRDILLVIFDRLYRAREALGFVLADDATMRSLSEEFSSTDYDDHEQTAYIPSRVWTYQVTRLRECLNDFLAHRAPLDELFNFCVDAYARNHGSVAAAMANVSKTGINPFEGGQKKISARTGREFLGPFQDTAKRFGVDNLLRKWAATPGCGLNIVQLSTYLSLVQYVGLAYIGNFTLQRSSEFCTLRADCLLWEEDPVFGRMPIIRGETTKTDPDSDARWPTSPSVEVAVEALTAIARMRIRCACESSKASVTEYDKKNPLLLSHAYEPWSTTRSDKCYAARPSLPSYSAVAARFHRLFDPQKLRITQEDLDTARLFTPNLDKAGCFAVGKIWPLAYHQLRRTGAVNMFASGLLSDSSIQVIMKHLTLLQTRYYGKHFSRLRFNREWEEMTVTARYEVMAKQMQAVTEERYVSPYGEERKQQIALDLIGERDFDLLIKEGIKGNVLFRAIRLGGCTNREHCEYGGIESISRCTGGDGDKPCSNVIYDRMKRPSVERQLECVQTKVNTAKADSPRARALQAEAQGLRNFLHDTRQSES